ncbi:MAG TPA: hypothetical protein VF469_10865 [Kofleriaceae bacterium]
MKKHKRNATFHTPGRQNTPLAIRRETVRALTGDDLALVAGGSSTVLTEKPPTTTGNDNC